MNRLRSSRRAVFGLVAVAILLAVSWASVRLAPGTQALSQPSVAPNGSRFAASGDRFELVGALEGRRLTLWLDGLDDNAPIVGAALEIEIGDAKLVARAIDDRYETDLPVELPAGASPVTVTVTAGDDIDLLAADLVVPAGLERSR